MAGEKRSRTGDLMNAVALFVAVVALYVAWDQARIGRNQPHADVVPVLRIGTTYVTAENRQGRPVRRFKLEVTNVAIGPAYVDTAQ
ncbi:MAG: hypothetical protein AAGA68_18005 [Pseudomonadota bacterium]